MGYLGHLSDKVHFGPESTFRESRNPDSYRVGIIRSRLVTDDAQRDWPAVRAAERYRGQVYRSFNKDESAAGGVSGNTREASIPQTWVVGNVEHCVKELTSFVREYGITDLVTWAVPPAMRPEQMNGSLERFARDLAPASKPRPRPPRVEGRTAHGCRHRTGLCGVSVFRCLGVLALDRHVRGRRCGFDLADGPDRQPPAVP
jgi:hypothetical protein